MMRAVVDPEAASGSADDTHYVRDFSDGHGSDTRNSFLLTVVPSEAHHTGRDFPVVISGGPPKWNLRT
jgi:hypothetical protein